jgi:hypothetical protein
LIRLGRRQSHEDNLWKSFKTSVLAQSRFMKKNAGYALTLKTLRAIFFLAVLEKAHIFEVYHELPHFENLHDEGTEFFSSLMPNLSTGLTE